MFTELNIGPVKLRCAFSQGGGINVEKMDYTGGAEPVQLRVGLIDAGFLETLGVQPILGRIISRG
jgi:hypothetical protein